jgi:sulfotransferase family protein
VGISNEKRDKGVASTALHSRVCSLTVHTVSIRIAMWSGPRNISTAMMRSWGNRDDTRVIDEPFYAYYLKATGIEHPGANEVIATGETDWRKIVAHLSGPVANGKRIFFQKQMTHHLLPEIDREWIGAVANCFLIRDPREVIHSYVKKREDPALEDLGFVQQEEIFNFVRTHTNAVPPVIDARDVLEDPERTLALLCDAIGIEFNKSMLSWPPGLRDTDGVWARYWYGEVAKTSSFQPYRPADAKVPAYLGAIHDRCRECYERLFEYRLR